MTVNSFIATLGKHLSPANRAILSEVADNPVVAEIFAKAEQGTLTERQALKASLDAIPAKYAKQIKSAAAECAAAYDAERRAEEVLAAARARRSSAVGAAHGVETLARCEADRIKTALQASAPNLLVAALRAVWAFSLEPYMPDFNAVAVARHSGYDRDAQAAYLAALAEADAINGRLRAHYATARDELDKARAKFEAMKLEPLPESTIAERISETFEAVNTALVPFKGEPHFVINEHMDVVVKFGHNQTALTVKPGDIGGKQ